jgi:hypothetical protein
MNCNICLLYQNRREESKNGREAYNQATPSNPNREAMAFSPVIDELWRPS